MRCFFFPCFITVITSSPQRLELKNRRQPPRLVYCALPSEQHQALGAQLSHGHAHACPPGSRCSTAGPGSSSTRMWWRERAGVPAERDRHRDPAAPAAARPRLRGPALPSPYLPPRPRRSPPSPARSTTGSRCCLRRHLLTPLRRDERVLRGGRAGPRSPRRLPAPAPPPPARPLPQRARSARPSPGPPPRSPPRPSPARRPAGQTRSHRPSCRPAPRGEARPAGPAPAAPSARRPERSRGRSAASPAISPGTAGAGARGGTRRPGTGRSRRRSELPPREVSGFQNGAHCRSA